MWWTVIGVVASFLTMFGFVPQIVKMRKTHSVKDVSELTLVQFGIGAILWMFYGIHLKDFIVIGANVISLLTIIVALGLYLRFNQGFIKKKDGMRVE